MPYRRGSLVQDLLQVNRILCIICGGLKQEDLSMTKVKITDLSPAEVESLLRNEYIGADYMSRSSSFSSKVT